MIKKIIGFALAVITVCSVVACSGVTGNGNTTGTETMLATEPGQKSEIQLIKDPVDMKNYVKFTGRTYVEGMTTYFNWSLSGFEFNFNGTGVEALIVTSLGYNGTSAENNGMLWVYVDGDTENRTLIELDEVSKWYTLAEGLEEGPHNIRVVKRTEVGYSTAGLEELRVYGELTEKSAEKKLKIEVIGDSFACGDGCYTVGGSSAFVSVNQDSTMSYAKLIGDYYDAEVNVVAKCGIGLVWDYAGNTVDDGAIALPQIYEYTDYFHKGADNTWNFGDFEADVIILNIGTNDSSYIPRDKNRWINTYVDFLKTIRKYNPEAGIICTQGATNCISDFMCFNRIAKKAEDEGIENVYFYTMKKDYNAAVDGSGVGMHPSPAVHRKTADQLIAEIERLNLIAK